MNTLTRLRPAHLSFALVALLAGASPLAQTPASFDLERTQEVLTELIDQELAKGVASVSIALVAEDDIVWTAAFGAANVYTETPATPETIYCTGSTFKAVTATAILQLVEQGKIALDDPINATLGAAAVDDIDATPVTFRHILCHSSGLTAGANTAPLAPSTTTIVARTGARADVSK